MDAAYDGVPKYHRLKRALVERINEEELVEDQKIPSERILIDEFNVSRITVRKAIDELVNEGYLYKVQGKGTYVKGTKAKQDLFSITSCTRDIIAHGMEPRRKVLNLEVMKTDKKRSRQLEIDPKDNIVLIDRVYYADDLPLNRTIAYLPERYFPKLHEHDFSSQSLYEVLEEEYGVKITRAKRTIEAVLAQGETAKQLQVEEGKPIILFRAVTYGVVNRKEVPIETFKCLYRTDQFKFYIDQIRQ